MGGSGLTWLVAVQSQKAVGFQFEAVARAPSSEVGTGLVDADLSRRAVFDPGLERRAVDVC